MSYKIDPYFSEAKLLIECNKYDHKYKDIGDEINQQTFTEDQLKCIFIRYYPELKNLTTERGLNRIFNTTFTPNFLVSRKLQNILCEIVILTLSLLFPFLHQSYS